MFTRQLGRTDLLVSALCFGGNVFGWTLDEHGSFAVLDAFMEGGGNFIDTADVYGQGTSESILGRWMSSRKNRDRIILATKLGHPMGNDPTARGLSRRYMQQAVEASLQRLQTDAIDLYQAHTDDPATPLAETMAAFDELVQQGKVRYVGASNYSAARLREALAVSDHHGYVRYSCLQPPYNLVNRAAYEGELESMCLEQGLGVIPYSSLASGFLTGKYRPGRALPASPRASRIQERYMHEQGFRVVEQLEHIAEAHGATVAQVALVWLMARPGITAPIASATSVEQVRELLEAATVQLTPAEMAALNTVSA
ncbi:MAG TPA: aldo/keto reductase [Ktedonobacteraceae bacterium]